MKDEVAVVEEKSIRETINGLSSDEARRRLEQNGRNELKEEKPMSVFATFLEQLNDPLIYVLLAAAAISILLNEISLSLIHI